MSKIEIMYNKLINLEDILISSISQFIIVILAQNLAILKRILGEITKDVFKLNIKLKLFI